MENTATNSLCKVQKRTQILTHMKGQIQIPIPLVGMEDKPMKLNFIMAKKLTRILLQ